jgi:hypothetical protein
MLYEWLDPTYFVEKRDIEMRVRTSASFNVGSFSAV